MKIPKIVKFYDFKYGRHRDLNRPSCNTFAVYDKRFSTNEFWGIRCLQYYYYPASISAAYLIGGTDQKTEGVWEWADGTEFTFTDWGPGQPDNFINAEDCLTYYRPLGLASDYFWADVSCDVPAELYICERAYV